MKAEITTYLNSQSRNKVIFHSSPIDNVDSNDIGRLLAESIKGIKDDKRLSLKTSIILDEIFDTSEVTHQDLGRILAIKNFGIIFESELKLDFLHLLDKYSRTNALFIQWEGEIENNTLYFLSKQKGQKINIKNLSHIAI